MALTVGTQTYDRFILDPEDESRYVVTYRPLRARDKAELEDTIRMQMGEEDVELRPGTMRRLTILRSVVKITDPNGSPVAVSDAWIDDLHGDVYEALYAWVSWGTHPPEQDQETGLPLEVKPNREQRRAKPKKGEKVAAAAS